MGKSGEREANGQKSEKASEDGEKTVRFRHWWNLMFGSNLGMIGADGETIR
jgi:hypothetical protein